MSSLSFRTRFTLAVAIGVVLAPAAHAALGGNVASVQHDHETLHAQDVVTSTAGYDLHEATSAEGVRIREYVDRSSGRVFAVSWTGPRSPDLNALLGTYAARYESAARAHRTGHHVLSINDPDLVLTVMRMPRGWQGYAYLPGAIPDGVPLSELR